MEYNKKRLICVVGARPQFIKHAPLEIALREFFYIKTIHTGQHYDAEMSRVFFDQLKISCPDYMLSNGALPHGAQTGRMLEQIEEILLKEKPDGVIVYGDTNSTLAGALAASKLQISLIHIEAGLRSYNKAMPEEINRVLTDHISDYLFTPTATASENLTEEGINGNIYMVGDVMCDSILLALDNISEGTLGGNYYYASIHRPYNTDDRDRLKNILTSFSKFDKEVKFFLHPRTKKKIEEIDISFLDRKVSFLSPVSYFENIKMIKNSSAVITDSGGVQKEAFMLRKKCITIRSETEWTETLKGNWNTLLYDLKDIVNIHNVILQPPDYDKYNGNIYGDGRAAVRIAELLVKKI